MSRAYNAWSKIVSNLRRALTKAEDAKKTVAKKKPAGKGKKPVGKRPSQGQQPLAVIGSIGSHAEKLASKIEKAAKSAKQEAADAAAQADEEERYYKRKAAIGKLQSRLPEEGGRPVNARGR